MGYAWVMDILVVGGHGKVALRLLRLLAERGHRARGLIRKPEQAADLEAVGAVPVIGDLEIEPSLTKYAEGADVVVFAAGAGPGSGAERKRTVDLGGAVKLVDAAVEAGVRRYVMISSIGADRAETVTGSMRPYLEAKAEADRHLVGSGLDYVIVRPGSLTDEPATGRVRLTTDLGGSGSVTRDDVAAVLAEILQTPPAGGTVVELFGGDVAIGDAVRALGSPAR